MTPRNSARHIAVLASGYALSVAAATGLLGRYHAYAGQPPAERMAVLFLLPVTATVIWALIRSLQRRRAPAQENGSAEAAVHEIVFWVLAFLVAVHAMVVGVLFGGAWLQPWASRAVVVFAGAAAMVVGNQLPRTRPNMAIGIRTWRTLTDRQLWMLTHRVTGYTAVAVGAITLFAGLFLPRTQVAAVPGTAFLLSLVWLTAFYWKAALRAHA